MPSQGWFFDLGYGNGPLRVPPGDARRREPQGCYKKEALTARVEATFSTTNVVVPVGRLYGHKVAGEPPSLSNLVSPAPFCRNPQSPCE